MTRVNHGNKDQTSSFSPHHSVLQELSHWQTLFESFSQDFLFHLYPIYSKMGCWCTQVWLANFASEVEGKPYIFKEFEIRLMLELISFLV